MALSADDLFKASIPLFGNPAQNQAPSTTGGTPALPAKPNTPNIRIQSSGLVAPPDTNNENENRLKTFQSYRSSKYIPEIPGNVSGLPNPYGSMSFMDNAYKMLDDPSKKGSTQDFNQVLEFIKSLKTG